eukprot:176279-Chlamydomonas_euryale.AAC.4
MPHRCRGSAKTCRACTRPARNAVYACKQERVRKSVCESVCKSSCESVCKARARTFVKACAKRLASKQSIKAFHKGYLATCPGICCRPGPIRGVHNSQAPPHALSPSHNLIRHTPGHTEECRPSLTP